LDLNWGRYATEGVAIEELPGDHGQILNEPGLSVLARQLSDALAHEGGSVSFAGLRDLEEQLQVRSYREVGFDNKEGDEVHTGMSAIVSQGRVHIEI
jgi:hypothetical protein